MSKRDQTSEEKSSPQKAPDMKKEADAAASDSPKASVSKGALVVFVIIVLSLVWYLLADRFTPYTSQARIGGYVVGVAPNVAGVVTEVWVKNNQKVDAGQTLFRIDPAQYQIALQKAKSDLATAHRQVDAGSASVESARANLVSARANARKAEQDFSRQQKLRKEDPGTISLRRLEVAEATLEEARARVTSTEAGIRRAIEQMGGEDDADNAIVKSAESAVAKAEQNLADTVVKATSKGIVTDLRADVGRYAGTGSPVLTLVTADDVWINAEFTENNLGHLRAGSQVEILFDALPGRVFDGEVRSVGLGVSDGQSAVAGTLPTIQNDRDWLRQAQRFPVVIGFDVATDDVLRAHLRIGGQASVMGYTEGHGVLNLLGKGYIRLMSLFSYAY